MRRTYPALSLLLILSGCDRIGFGGGNAAQDQDNRAVAASANGSAGSAAEGPRTADAGITSSRSFQPLPEDNAAAGLIDGKPTAEPAGFGPAMLIGRWGDNGDCSKNVIEILAGGSFRMSDGAVGAWSLDQDRLTFRGNQGTATLRLQSIDNDNLIVVNPDGSVGRSQRC